MILDICGRNALSAANRLAPEKLYPTMADRDRLIQLNARSSNLDISSIIVDEVDGGRHNASDPDIVGT